jgi:hypothetical protein
VRHVHFSGRQTHDAIPPPARGPEHSDALSCLLGRRRADHQSLVALKVPEAGRAEDPQPSRADDHARWQAERLDAQRRQKQHLRELAAAIETGDAAYRQLCDRLDDFGTRLAVVRRRLSTSPAGRPVGAASSDGIEAVSRTRRSSRQPQVLSLRAADGLAV